MEGNISITMHYYCTLLFFSMLVTGMTVVSRRQQSKYTEPSFNSYNNIVDSQQSLKKQDDYLVRIREEGINFTKQFLSAGNKTDLQTAMKLINEFIIGRQNWFGKQQLLTLNFEGDSRGFAFNETDLETRNEELEDMNCTLRSLQNISTAIKFSEFLLYLDSEYSNNSERNMYNFDTIESLVTNISACMEKFQAAVRNLDLKLKLTESIDLPWMSDLYFILNKYYYTYFYDTVLQENINVTHKDEDDIKLLFQYYIYPGVYIIILIIGVVGNGTILLIFLLHREMRMASNVMIFNLAIVDIANLFINVPLYYVFKYYSSALYLNEISCKVYAVYRFFNQAVMYVTVVALSCQRYIAISSVLRTTEPCCRLSSRSIAAIYIISVWCISLLIAVPPQLVYDFRVEDCFPYVRQQVFIEVLDVFYSILGCVFPPVLVTIFSLLTARLLKRSVRDIPGVVRNNARKINRYRSAKVVIALTIAFCICYIPRNTWFFVASYFHISRQDVKYIYLDEVTNYLLFSNSIQNPIALYIASSSFRNLFNKYLFKCCSKNNSNPSRNTTVRSRTTQRLTI